MSFLTKDKIMLVMSKIIAKLVTAFNYGHGLLRDIRNAGVHLKAWDTLAGDRNLWHAITQQKNVHCNAAGGGYAWLDSPSRNSSINT
jgi:hypothetical protein